MQARAHEICVGCFLHVGVRHFRVGAVRHFKRQGWQRQSYPQYRHQSGEGHQPGPDQQWADQQRPCPAADDQFTYE
jgi:hypothetical protein